MHIGQREPEKRIDRKTFFFLTLRLCFNPFIKFDKFDTSTVQYGFSRTEIFNSCDKRQASDDDGRGVNYERQD